MTAPPAASPPPSCLALVALVVKMAQAWKRLREGMRKMAGLAGKRISGESRGDLAWRTPVRHTGPPP
jgi:hypothetical protein